MKKRKQESKKIIYFSSTNKELISSSWPRLVQSHFWDIRVSMEGTSEDIYSDLFFFFLRRRLASSVLQSKPLRRHPNQNCKKFKGNSVFFCSRCVLEASSSSVCRLIIVVGSLISFHSFDRLSAFFFFFSRQTKHLHHMLQLNDQFLIRF